MMVQRAVKAGTRTTVLKGTLSQHAALARKRKRKQEKDLQLQADAREFGCSPDELKALRFQADVIDNCGLRQPATKARVGAPIIPMGG